MDEFRNALRTPGAKGCLGSAAGFLVLAAVSPFALMVHVWRRWRRGGGTRVEVQVDRWTGGGDRPFERIDVTIDVPVARGDETRREVTDTVIRIAETLRCSDDVYNVIYRLPSDDEAVVLPVGPQLQELGERLFLTLNQGTLAGRTAVWLTLGRKTALASVVKGFSADPEGDGEPENLLATPGVSWSMASEWAEVGPSLVIRLVLVAPAADRRRIVKILSSLDRPA
jgi:hypothetical protein